jgi:hypothetical protein
MTIFSYKNMFLVEHNYLCHAYEVSLKMQLMKTYTLGQDASLEHQMISEWKSDNLFLPPLPYKYNKQSHGNLQGYRLRATTVLVSHLRLLGNENLYFFNMLCTTVCILITTLFVISEFSHTSKALQVPWNSLHSIILALLVNCFFYVIISICVNIFTKG